MTAVVTARTRARVADLVEARPQTIALEMDLTDQRQIDAAVAAARDTFGRLDVLVNNAGYGYQATAEDGVEAEIRA